MRDYLRKIDLQTTGNRYDVTPLFADRVAFAQLVNDLSEPFAGSQVDLVGCIDALGFILGTAIAERLSAGVLPIRKGGKLPVEAERESCLDYTGEEKSLEIRKDLLKEGDRVLLVDEWVETGAQIEAAIALLERQGAAVIGIATIQMDDCERTLRVQDRYRVVTVWE